jgi:hypothetical protein
VIFVESSVASQRALEDTAVFINKAARWASIKQVEILKFFLKKKKKK